MTLQSPLLEVDDLHVRFGDVRAVDGLSLHIARGETLGLVGESGSGKSTTGRAILQLVPRARGTVRLAGETLPAAGHGAALRRLRKHAQMVFQDPFGSLNQRMRVADIIAEPLEINRIGDAADRRRRVEGLLEQVGLPPDAARRFPHEFSGGQRQRIGIARALAVEPSLLVLDEPVAALDVSIQAQIIQLLKSLQRDTAVTFLFIAHDLNVVRHISHRSAVMYLGRIVEDGPSETLFSTPRHPYTRALVSAVPALDPDSGRHRQVLKGEVPSPANPPSGCTFRTRCSFAQARCAQEIPQLRPAGLGVRVACHFWEEIEGQEPPVGDGLRGLSRRAIKEHL